MYWVTKNLGTAPIKELKEVRKLKDAKIETVIDLKDKEPKSKSQFESKLRHIEEAIKKNKRVIVICKGGMNRSNGIVLTYLMENGYNFEKAYDLIKRKVPIAKIRPDWIKFIKKEYTSNIKHQKNTINFKNEAK